MKIEALVSSFVPVQIPSYRQKLRSKAEERKCAKDKL